MSGPKTYSADPREGTRGDAKMSELEIKAFQTAEQHSVSDFNKKGSILAPLRKLEGRLQTYYQYIRGTTETQLAAPVASEWLLDNYFIVRTAIRQIREDMPKAYYQQLPKLDNTSAQGQPRIYALAFEALRFCQTQPDIDHVRQFVHSYQQVAPLTMGEIWALPTMLRFCILENLAHALSKITDLNAQSGPEEIPPLETDPTSIVANSIMCLRQIATIDWKEFFENVSRVDKELTQDPAGVYAAMDFETRDRYRGVVEDLALQTSLPEEAVARQAIQLAQERLALCAQSDGKNETSLDRDTHVGYYLVDQGRERLEENLAYRPPWREKVLRWRLKHAPLVYLSRFFCLTLLVLGAGVYYAFWAGGTFLELALVTLLGIVPASAVAISLVNWTITRTIPPRILPKMDFSEGIPPQFRTMVVVPSLLLNRQEVKNLLQQIELHFLGNDDPSLQFALLTDFTDSPHRDMPDDEDLLEQTIAGIRALNSKYIRSVRDQKGAQVLWQPFYLFHRKRMWNPKENCWMGWERKRGKLIEFNQLLLGKKDTTYSVKIGDFDVLPAVKYVITLDADTNLPRDTAKQLVATFAHPLNRAQFNTEDGSITAGYSILQPRIQIKPTSANQSWIARVFSGGGGLDLYTRAVSDVYQDLFGEGIYVGKGIYDVAAFEESLAGRVPENTLLSHDLFEGIHGRVGLASDISLLEDYPSHYLAHAHRRYRWIRGDWQLLPWLFPSIPHATGRKIPNDLSISDRWKILDNLRRSLFTPTMLAFLVFGWLLFPGSVLVWLGVVLLARIIPSLTSIQLLFVRREGTRRFSGIIHPTRTTFYRLLLSMAFLPYEAILIFDAIASTLFRLAFTRKRLLQWSTTAHTIQIFGAARNLPLLWRRMGTAPLMALGIAILTGLLRPEVLPIASPFLVAWFFSPQIALWISKPLTHTPPPLSKDHIQQLRRTACRTWLFFERFVSPDDQWLPPDHYQEHPRGVIASRTSPTNIGLFLASALAAYDLGYTGPFALLLLLNSTIESLNKLEKYRGHILNWYDTRTLEPLLPRYVSTVDSGNLVAALMTLNQGIGAISEDPVIREQWLEGFLDTLGVFEEVLNDTGLGAALNPLLAHLSRIRREIETTKRDPTKWLGLLTWLLTEGWQEISSLLEALIESHTDAFDAMDLTGLHVWADRVYMQISSSRRELETLLPWLTILPQTPALFSLPATDTRITSANQELANMLLIDTPIDKLPLVCLNAVDIVEEIQILVNETISPADRQDAEIEKLYQDAQAWCADLIQKLHASVLHIRALVIGFQRLEKEIENFIEPMDFSFLFDDRRKIFHIGYNVEVGKVDQNHYDLLASEARLASLLAIAKGDVPQSHWLYLARPLTQANGSRALLSWSGTMFEYLMPSLFLNEGQGTLLDQSCMAAVQHQIRYGRNQKTPWGISESGFYHFDSNMNYQYRAFGVPGLGLKRGLEEDQVITPHASFLALKYAPQAAVDNLQRLVALGAYGHYGFYEALDYTHTRIGAGNNFGLIRSYMAHHQGMILLALANYLLGSPMVKRFHANIWLKSVEMLLHETVPRQTPVESPHPEEVRSIQLIPPRKAVEPWAIPVSTPMPQVHFLSNGNYSVLITNAGAGYSQWKDISLTRWRADTTLDHWGTWIYIQDQERDSLWSAGYQPTCRSPEHQEVVFYPHMVEFQRRDDEITTMLEITVPPSDDLEIRLLTITNHSASTRRIRVTSYGEVTMARLPDDRRHPAFNKLFIEDESIPELNTLLFRRRTRSSEEQPVFVAHTLVSRDELKDSALYLSDRAAFTSKGVGYRAPTYISTRIGQGQKANTEALRASLDPVMCLSQEFELRPHRSIEVAYLTIAASARRTVLDVAQRYQSWSRIKQAFNQAHSSCEHELGQLDLTSQEIKLYQQLLSTLLYPHKALRANPGVLSRNTKGQAGLWPFAISGDHPILLAQIGHQEESDLVVELLKAHAYWRKRGIKVDLVLLNLQDTSYDQSLHHSLLRLVNRTGVSDWLYRRGGIFLLQADQITPEDQVLLETAARAVLHAEQGPLADQLRDIFATPLNLPRFLPTTPPATPDIPTPPVPRPADLLFDNGYGGFHQDGKEYQIYLEGEQWTPAPWVNVIANPHFGFMVSESGSGYTWAENSGENRLTPWHNDPLLDIPGEAVYLRDEETGEIWTPTPLPIRDPNPYLIRHGAGYTCFEHNSHGLNQSLQLFVVKEKPLKIARLRIKNISNRTRRISATYYAEWVLGTDRDTYQQYLQPEFDATSHAILARNPYNREFGARVAFLSATREPHSLTTDRREFLGRLGTIQNPAALGRVGLASAVDAGLDPCAAMQILLWVAPGETKEVAFLLGQGADRNESLQLIRQYQNIKEIDQAWDDMRKFWDDLLSTIVIQTPEPAMDILLNQWLLYQALSCRIWGRSALYQSSGAYGFRDQLQDVMALIHAAPHITREHILRAAGYQFTEGDVLHWWHPPSGRGVRTRCSDDLLWLPYVTAHYIQTSGDEPILDEEVNFLAGDPLEDGEHERYDHYPTSSEVGTVADHCLRAIDKGSTKGIHGIPLIGSHDWNDGMNRVGIEGKGESVWNGWFLYAILDQFADLWEAKGETMQTALYKTRAQELASAIEQEAWDGAWYRRAYYDDGAPVGSRESDENQIDLLPQSWAVLSKGADSNRAQQAMDSVFEKLVRKEDGILLLFTPPFDKTSRDPGYIKGYPPGIRENGGQYTHAALWTVWAFAELGQGDRAEALFRMLNPIYHSDTSAKALQYRVEPYVVAADVYSVLPYTGRGGWTWYTGSASWMYRVGIEAILGFKRAGDQLQIDPCIPRAWEGYTLTYHYQDTIYRIEVDNPDRVERGVKEISLDGKILPADLIPLTNDGKTHRVQVILSAKD
jgi:cyclic beta-1,2-glucan synthetase